MNKRPDRDGGAGLADARCKALPLAPQSVSWPREQLPGHLASGTSQQNYRKSEGRRLS